MDTIELENKFGDIVLINIFVLDNYYVKVEVETNLIANENVCNMHNFKQREKLKNWLSNQFNEAEAEEIFDACIGITND